MSSTTSFSYFSETDMMKKLQTIHWLTIMPRCKKCCSRSGSWKTIRMSPLVMLKKA